MGALQVMAQLVNSARGGKGSGNIEICFFRSIRIVLAKVNNIHKRSLIRGILVKTICILH